MKKALSVTALAVLVISVILSQCKRGVNIQEQKSENPQDVFRDSAVVDLGKHIIAYRDSLEHDEWIVLYDLDNECKTYIPYIGETVEIGTEDFMNIYMKVMEEERVQEVNIPVCLIPEGDCVEMRSARTRVIKDMREQLPIEVWKQNTGDSNEKYTVSLERISVPYKFPDLFAQAADYMLTVRDEYGYNIQQLFLTNLFIPLETIYWMQDINGDGFSDLIFCADNVVGNDNVSTELCFLVWNSNQKRYEEKPFPKRYVTMPVWNEKEDALMFYEEGENEWVVDRKMYRFLNGEWKLCGEVLTESGAEPLYFRDYYQAEVYYKELDYFYREIIYEKGVAVRENITQDSPLYNENSIWYLDDANNEKLFPTEIIPLQ